MDFLADLFDGVDIVDVASTAVAGYAAYQGAKSAKAANKIRQQELDIAKKQAAKANELAEHERRKLQYAKGIQNHFSGDYYGGYATPARHTQF